MRATFLEQKISEIIAPALEDQGLSLVCVKITGEGGSRTVQVMAEDPETRRLGVDQCAALSKAVSVLLDVEDPIEGAYRLEVSSPGIDRPLMKPEDFEVYSGFEAKIETQMPTETGQKRFRGILKGLKEGDLVLIDTDQGEAEIPFASLTKAKLVLTDKLIEATGNTN